MSKSLSLCRMGMMMTHQNISDSIIQFFAYQHLPERLANVSKPFGDLATTLLSDLPSNPERTVALRKLLEAKDAAVRAALYQYAKPTAAA